MLRKTKSIGLIFLQKRFYAKLDYEVYNPLNKKLTKEVDASLNSIVVLHGLLGNHRNLRLVTQKLCDKLGKYQAVSVTQRGHGRSETGEPPHNVESASMDVENLLRSISLTPSVIIGHSFGGKVATRLCEDLTKTKSSTKALVLLDSIPFANAVSEADVDDEESVLNVLKTLGTIPLPIVAKTQSEVGKFLHDSYKLPQKIALWLTTSLRSQSTTVDPKLKEFNFTFNVQLCQKLLDDFISKDYSTNLKDLVEQNKDLKILCLCAGKNTTWKLFDQEMESLQQESRQRIKFETIENVGHWLHTEDPDGVVEKISQLLN
eukprot:snap_masked-scaffold_12-processed-gene-8.39-mRNA-1 protein AED:1.00 eAED:1.00 QI:0/0/0/0/1/1/2/0/317